MPANLNTATLSESTLQSRVALDDVHLNIEAGSYETSYNKTPFGFTHNLHQLDIFQFDSILETVE